MRSLDRDVLLVTRFDRVPTSEGMQRRLMISGLTLLGLDEMMGRYATYPDLADVIRTRFEHPGQSLRELFARIVFNVCVGNIDDHAHNHSAFWDGQHLRLTPAYDVCPQPRSGEQAAQAMAIGRAGQRESTLRTCREAAAVYELNPSEADDITDHIVSIIQDQWLEAADLAHLSEQDKRYLWQRQILNPFIHHG